MFNEISEFFKKSSFQHHCIPQTIRLIFHPEINEPTSEFKQNPTFNLTFGNVSNRNFPVNFNKQKKPTITKKHFNFDNDNKTKI